jgi:hypothetical protein
VKWRGRQPALVAVWAVLTAPGAALGDHVVWGERLSVGRSVLDLFVVVAIGAPMVVRLLRWNDRRVGRRPQQP